MKRISFIFILLVPCMVSFAQSDYPLDEAYGKKICELPKETILEQAQLEIIYQHLTDDPEINKTEEEYDILMVGKPSIRGITGTNMIRYSSIGIRRKLRTKNIIQSSIP